MNDPADLVLQELRDIRDGMSRIEKTQQSLGDRLSGIEGQLAAQGHEPGVDMARSSSGAGRTGSGDRRILAALRRSPLVDADLDLTRARVEGRPVDL